MKNGTLIAFLIFIVNSSIAQEPWFAKIKNATETKFPLIIDSLYMDRLFHQDFEIGTKQLHTEDLLFLCPGFDTLKNTYEFSTIKEFLFIDSLKSNDLYQDYIDNEIDIGMVQISGAFEIDHIKLFEETSLFLWGVYSSSFEEACPYTDSYYVIGTIIAGQKPVSFAILGENYSWGDAPYFVDNKTESQITDGINCYVDGNKIKTCSVQIKKTKIQGGEEEEEKTSETKDFLIIEGYLEYIREFTKE